MFIFLDNLYQSLHPARWYKKGQHQTKSHCISISMATNGSPTHLGMTRKTLEGHAAATNYINQFFQEHYFLDLDQLTEEHAEGENFSSLFEKIVIRLSSTHFRTHQNICIGNESKEEKFNIMK